MNNTLRANFEKQLLLRAVTQLTAPSQEEWQKSGLTPQVYEFLK